VKVLIEKGFAYEMDGDVYFSVEAFDHYGQLSGRNIEDMKAGARVDVDDRKRHPMDFALWKAAKPGEPSWESPWGLGRPGWHIECSAMSLKYLGTSFDFHGGGSDLIFPHHENEIAQSEAFSGVSPFVRYWLHNGFVTVNEEKMSKSLGNFFLVKDILERYSPEVLRLFILSTHYRSPLDFSDQRLDEAQKNLQRLSIAAETSKRALEHPKVDERETAEAGELIAAADEARKEFEDAMDDDFNTALAITALFSMAKVLNSYGNAVLRDEIGCNQSALMRAHETYAELSGILGLILKADVKEPVDDQLIDDLMGVILDLRKDARDKKDWAVSDEIRNRLKPLGIVIEDSAQGARWKRS